MGYHYRGGLYFNRVSDADGTVQIRLRTDPNDDESPLAFFVNIDADSWASIVAAMSRGGETGETVRIVRELHTGAPSSP